MCDGDRRYCYWLLRLRSQQSIAPSYNSLVPFVCALVQALLVHKEPEYGEQLVFWPTALLQGPSLSRRVRPSLNSARVAGSLALLQVS